MDKNGYTVSEANKEVATIARLLVLEREKRINAERLVETERQALLQLRNALEEKPQHRKEDEGTRCKMSSVSSTYSDPSSNDDAMSLSDGKLLASVFSQLPEEAQSILREQPTVLPDEFLDVLDRAMALIQCGDDQLLQQVLLADSKEKLIRVHGTSMLRRAAELGNAACLRVLLRGGCNPNSSGPCGGYPLLSAASNGHTDCLKALIDGGCDLSLSDSNRHTALHLALQHGRHACAETLLSRGSPLDCVTAGGNTLLHAAANSNMPLLLRTVIVQLRCSYSSPKVQSIINHRNKYGYTPLHEAAAEGFKDCVQVLCACPEVDTYLTDETGRTASDLATPDCNLLITSKDCKRAELLVVPSPGNRHYSSRVIGSVAILGSHSWHDLSLLVEGTLQDLSRILQLGGGGGGGGGRGHAKGIVASSGTPRSSVKVPDELSQLLAASPEQMVGVMEEVVEEKLKILDSLLPMGGNIKQLQIGDQVWTGEESATSPSPYSALVTSGDNQIMITLNGVSDSSLNEAAFFSLIPLKQLHDYTTLLMSRQALLIHGSLECDTQLIIRELINFLQQRYNEDNEEDENGLQIVNVPLHSSFTRDSLITMLHDSNLLVPYNRRCSSQAHRQRGRSAVLVMEGLEKLKSVEDVFSELFVAMQCREAGQPVWIDGVRGASAHDTLLPAGHYHLMSQCYIIAAHSSYDGFPSVMADHFAHITLSDNREPSTGLLLRHLLRKFVDTRKSLPTKFDPLYQTAMWIWKIWILYNHFMKYLSLHYLATGHKLFLTCPIEENSVEAIHNWLCEVWNHSLAPKVEEGVLHQAKEHAHHSRKETARLLLSFITHQIMQLTCPLSSDAFHQLLQKMCGTATLCSSLSSLSSSSLVSSSSSTASPKRTAKHSPAIRRLSAEPSTNGKRSPVPNNKMSKSRSSPQDVDTLLTPPGTAEKNDGHFRSRSPSLGGTLKKSLFRSNKTSTLTSVVEQKPHKQRKGSLEPRDTPNMDDLFDLLMVAGSDRLEEQRVPFSSVGHHILPTTSSDRSVNTKDHAHKPAIDSTQSKSTLSVHDRQRSRSVGGSVSEWKEVSQYCNGSQPPSVSSDSPPTSLDCQDLQHSNDPTVRRQSISNSLLFSSTLGCFSESTVSKLKTRTNKNSRTIPRNTIRGYYGDGVEL